jgi:hypothetical protein
MTRTRRETIDWDGRAYAFEATPIYEGWDIVVHREGSAAPLVAFEFWRDGERGPLADPTLGGLAREIIDFLLPPAKLRHATPERFEHEVAIYAANRRRGITPAERALMATLVEYAKHGTGFSTPKAVVDAAEQAAEVMGDVRAGELNARTLEGAVVRAALARVKLKAKKPIGIDELKALAGAIPGPFELPRGRDDEGLVPWPIAVRTLRERGVLP